MPAAIDLSRRTALQRGAAMGVLAAGLCAGRRAVAGSGDAPAFDAASMDEALAAIGGTPAPASQIALGVPELVENGAVVPVSVDSGLPGTTEIFIIVEANPHPMVVRFTIPEGTEPFVSTRIRMAASGPVFAVVRADGRLYAASRQTRVMVGGCG